MSKSQKEKMTIFDKIKTSVSNLGSSHNLLNIPGNKVDKQPRRNSSHHNKSPASTPNLNSNRRQSEGAINGKNKTFSSPFNEICEMDNEVLIKFKLGEWTNFHMAAYQDWSQDAIMNLNISLINEKDPIEGRTPLHIASQYDNYRFIKTVLSFYELDINGLDKHGYTALHIAAKHGHERCLSVLILSAKIDLNAGGYDSPCPLHLAVANNHVACVRILLQAGADLNASFGLKAKTALHMAAKKGNEQMCQILANFKPQGSKKALCRPGAVDYCGRTALHYAAAGNHCGVVDILVYSGAKINQRSNEGQTALHIAAEKGHRKMSQLLLKYRIDKKAVDKWGMKAVEYAMEKQYNDLVAILLSN